MSGDEELQRLEDLLREINAEESTGSENEAFDFDSDKSDRHSLTIDKFSSVIDLIMNLQENLAQYLIPALNL